jgi:hypothetical protein
LAFLLQISFDNSNRLNRKSFLFEYKGIAFKLVQNDPRRFADSLLTIVSVSKSPAAELAFARAAEFVSVLAWSNGSRATISSAGGSSWPDDWPLHKAKPSIRTLPRIPSSGRSVGSSLYRLANVKTEDQRKALTLFREADASNNDYLSFLFYWQVLEVGRGSRLEGYIDKTFRSPRNHLRLSREDLINLPLANKSMGTYLLKDCRDAISHLKGKMGRPPLDPDNPEDRVRMVYSVRAIKAFAEVYIADKLGLHGDPLYLVQRKRGEIPAFLDLSARQNFGLHANGWRGKALRRGLTGRPYGPLFRG